MERETRPPLTRRITAGLILLVAGWLLLHFLVHLALFVASVVVVVVAVFAVLWALRVLL